MESNILIQLRHGGVVPLDEELYEYDRVINSCLRQNPDRVVEVVGMDEDGTRRRVSFKAGDVLTVTGPVISGTE